MKIKGLENLTNEEINKELELGGKFVVFPYAISILVMTFKRSSDIFFLKSNESPIKYGYKYLLISLFLGWWGIPWGPIYTIQSIFNAFKGKDVTNELLEELNKPFHL
ncbi:MAG: hypothetical protein IKX43_08125 [Paludibacteraceae bacterium]|jgi:hypothetical protein|nr:hypothetical protein [Paludibacteraceae bacterium]